jgi:hypothetical protein
VGIVGGVHSKAVVSVRERQRREEYEDLEPGL